MWHWCGILTHQQTTFGFFILFLGNYYIFFNCNHFILKFFFLSLSLCRLYIVSWSYHIISSLRPSQMSETLSSTSQVSEIRRSRTARPSIVFLTDRRAQSFLRRLRCNWRRAWLWDSGIGEFAMISPSLRLSLCSFCSHDFLLRPHSHPSHSLPSRWF